MPELPEVTTIVNGLARVVRGRVICDAMIYSPKAIRGMTPVAFLAAIKDQKILAIDRRAKNILFRLSGGQVMIVHLRMTGHFIVTDDKNQVDAKGSWINPPHGVLRDPKNQFIRTLFYLSGGKLLAFSDLRKFATIDLVSSALATKRLEEKYGPEPLAEDFKADDFIRLIRARHGAVKAALLDQSLIVGIGNIYADEILWAARIHPKSAITKLSKIELRNLYQAIRDVLKLAIRLKGTSDDDYRDAQGKMGGYGKMLKAYRRAGQPCFRCQTILKRIVVNQRGTSFCPKCQKKK